MTIRLVRHLKVDSRWPRFCDAAGFARACRDYNEADVIRPAGPRRAGCPVVASAMRRAVDTARYLYGREPDAVTRDLVEVPLNPFIRTGLALPRLLWEAGGRLQWLLGRKIQPETFRQTRSRVRRFLSGALAASGDLIVISHGWVLKVMIRELHFLGFRGPYPAYLHNGREYVYRRD